MLPQLLCTPTDLGYVLSSPGGLSHLLEDLEFELLSLGHASTFETHASVRELLLLAAFGRLRVGRDVKLIKAALPKRLFELRLSLATESGEFVKGRLFAIEVIPSEIKLLGWFCKTNNGDPKADRLRQTRRALALLENPGVQLLDKE